MNSPSAFSPDFDVTPQENATLRFGGIQRLLGRNALTALQQAHIAVIGVGGVGSWSVEALARSGVGELTLIDLDDVCVSNVNRQLHALDGQIGRPKVEVLAERMRLINPDLKVHAVSAFITPHNLDQLLGAEIDHVVDAIDSLAAKTALVAHCKARGLGLTVTGAAGGLIDPIRIAQRDLARTEYDPLLSKLRRNLRKQHGFPRDPKRRFGVTCICSDEQRRYPSSDGEVCHAKPTPGDSTRLDCASGFGAATFVTGSFGFAAAAHAISCFAAE
ncbi:tRNA cyclic N6-threonylcarbamoyladenosine(37) synthase TcdA [Carnimonas nigrificans]|uniref:tRNA cyclic N6-threonylcarbamoyladenosine(37) synthase TcdA n=1 Tax=Carnimonas nigrificans TaxID=64323 RepID=UPI0004B1131C|nr:tRNA cyclic N6-threonylcarbamoyladenosine(37) synthase TcdA [Carnimonas nigrificans]